MLGTFFWKSTDQKRRFSKKQNIELTMLPQEDAKGRLAICLRQQYQFSTLAFFVKNNFFEKELLKTKQTVISAESQAFQKRLS